MRASIFEATIGSSMRSVAGRAAESIGRRRRTACSLGHHWIRSRTISFHGQNTRSRVPQLISRLEGGESVAIVRDAGTPGVSYPGLELIQAAIERAVPVDPIPGARTPLAV